ncbi:hypothetical protein L2E82_33056 [Cichorium intybus]|uniref:Uncharacterized protein n=1 Tax=Cichorium intybus TaxID=13427 RepID=A0ACB9BHQ1_CICIN|nr:hypothetical protein L2E82_33056 [Cichorium intybus]
MQSPRFQAIMHVTSGRKKRVPDIKSISHELNSEGVRHLPLWKPSNLSTSGDHDNVEGMERNVGGLVNHSKQVCKMTPNEFWLKCESIVRSLDDKRQELPMGILKQVH